jgi:hypothetical protein
MASHDVPRPKSGNDTALHLLLPGDWLDEAQELAGMLSKPGAVMTRADAVRLAIRRGIDELRAEAQGPKKRR